MTVSGRAIPHRGLLQAIPTRGRLIAPLGEVMLRTQVLRAFVGLLMSLLVLAMVACGGNEPAPTPTTSPEATSTVAASDSEGEWEALIAAARAEGELNIMAGGSASRSFRPIADAFQEKYGVEVRLSTGSSTANVDRVLAERAAGRFTEDFAFAGGRSGERLVDANALVPIEPLLIHPEVTDKSLWFDGHYWWSDESQRYMFSFAAAVVNPPGSISYNTELVDPDDITSMWDVLDPKWKVVAAPPTFASGQTSYVQLYSHPEVGPEWVEQFLSADHVTFSTDTRTSVDGLAQGKYHLAVLGANVEAEIEALEEQGLQLPVAILNKQLKEAGFLSGTGSSRNVEVLEGAPHPKAAQLFLNWFLSREGQTAMHELSDGTPSPTLRVDDIPFGKTLPAERREPGREYSFGSADPDFIAQIGPLTQQLIEVWQAR
jgi:ABC-type Fe3+ transport system substrate-binding protein